MQCPRTHTPLKKIPVGKVPVYVSEACGGVFFENQTLNYFKCGHEDRGKALVKHLSQFHNENLNEAKRVNCPICTDTVMMRRYYSPLHIVEIDECPGCGGIWLDTGELSKLQSLMLNEKERAILRAQLMEDYRHPKAGPPIHVQRDAERAAEKIESILDIATNLLRFW